MKIQVVKSPGGIESWLVEEHSVPIVALVFAFEGGSSQDPSDKDGVASFLARMLDQGAGDLSAIEFQDRKKDLALRIGFGTSKDFFSGGIEALTENRDACAELLKLAITQPRFDVETLERVRSTTLVTLARAAREPHAVANAQWDTVAFAGHVYARPVWGTEEAVAKITADDLESYRRRVFAKNTLKVAVVGDITPDQLGTLIDNVFGELPAKADLYPVPKVAPVGGGQQAVVDMDIPQSVAVFGMECIPRKDPDFMAANLLNHIVGGGGFASKLMEEVRVKRGLAYGVSTSISPSRHTSIIRGRVATRNEMMGTSLEVIRAELEKTANGEVSQAELDNAKSYLIGSYPLSFDSNARIARQLLSLRIAELEPDYVDKRNDQVAAVTLDDLKRVAKRLLGSSNFIVTVVGRPVLATAS